MASLIFSRLKKEYFSHIPKLNRAAQSIFEKYKRKDRLNFEKQLELVGIVGKIKSGLFNHYLHFGFTVPKINQKQISINWFKIEIQN